MKKWFLLLALVAAFALQAQIDIYGSVRYGLFYENQDKDMTGVESRMFELQSLYPTSHLGANFKRDDMIGKLELGVSNSGVSLRHAYGEINLNGMYLLVGQTFTGFDWAGVSSQIAPVTVPYESAFIGYGAFYDSRHPMIRLRSENGFYVSLMKPKKMDPAGLNEDEDDDFIDALIPRINMGMKLKSNNMTFHPTFGLAMSNYNEDESGTDESVMAMVAALSMTYKADAVMVKAQIGGGQNVSDYGIITSTAANALWIDNKVENVITMGGFAELGYVMNEKSVVKAGLGYISSDHDEFEKPDQGMAIFMNLTHKIQSNVSIIPEIGMIDNMKSKNDGEQGSKMYGGLKFQLDLK